MIVVPDGSAAAAARLVAVPALPINDPVNEEALMLSDESRSTTVDAVAAVV